MTGRRAPSSTALAPTPELGTGLGAVLGARPVGAGSARAEAEPTSAPRWTFALGLAGAAILSALVRLPFLNASIAADEGGIAAIARWWSRGSVLYRDIFLDRPQALIWLFRFADWLAPSRVIGIRLVALGLGMITAVLIGLLGRELSRNPSIGVCAAVVYALVGSSPALEAFSLYGEVAVGAPSAACLLFFVKWSRRTSGSETGGRAADVLALVTGLFGGIALLMKQSGVDGIGVVLCALIYLTIRRRRGAGRGLLFAVVGLSLPLALSVAHGISVGFRYYWDAMAGYRLRYVSAVDGATADRLARLGAAINRIAPLLVVLGILAVAGLTDRRVSRNSRLLLVGWFGWAMVGFFAGGLFWLHYFIGPALPLCALAGIGANRWVRQLSDSGSNLRRLVVVVALAATAGTVMSQNRIATNAARSRASEKLLELDRGHHIAADYLRAHTKPSDRFQALWQSGAIAWLADRQPVHRFLWATWFEVYPGAVDELTDDLNAADRPLYLVLLHPVDAPHPVGRPLAIGHLKMAITQHYREEATVDGVVFLRAKGR